MFGTLPLFSIVVPARNAASTLADALTPLFATGLARDAFELIVVDDASDDTTATVAARYADTIVRLSGPPAGLAYARNRGAELARGEILVFVDADVRVGPDTISGMIASLNAHPRLAAVSATHADCQRDRGFVSRYWNLLVQFGEQTYSEASAHLNSACSAVRRSVFLSSGMYDEWRFATGCLDGVEFAQRLHAAGHLTMLRRDLTISGLATWNFRSVLREVWRRSEFLARSLGYHRTRERSRGEVIFTLTESLIPVLAIVALVVVSSAFVTQPLWWAGAIVLAIVLLANLRLHRFIARVEGPAMAIAVAPLHLLAQLVAIVGLCAGRVLHDTVGDRLPDAKTQAYSEVGLEIWPPVPRRS